MARPNRQMRVSPDLISLIKHFEMDSATGGPVLVAEPCVVGVPTAGWGSTTYLDESGVRQPVVTGMEFTHDECEAMLLADVERHADIIRRNVDVPLSQGEFDGLTSLACNIIDFEPKFRRSRTLSNLRDMKLSVERADRDRFQQEFTKEFLDWDKGTIGGEIQRLRGLYRRRCAERLLMLGLPWERAASYELVTLDTPFEDILTRAYNIQSEAQLSIPRRSEPEAEKPNEVQPGTSAPAFDPRASEPVRQPRQRARREPQLRERSINSRAPSEVSYGVEEDGRSKPMEEAGRFHAAAEQREGRLYQWVALLLGAPVVVLDRFVDVIARYADIVLIIALIVGAVGSLRWVYGYYRRQRAEEEATELMH